MKLYTSILLILLFVGGAFAQEERTWKTFSPAAGNWSILSPGEMEPDEEASKPKSNKGSYGYKISNKFFAVIYRDMPKVPKKIEKYYDDTRNSAVKGFNGKLVKEYPFRNGLLTGREILVEGETRMERARLFFHGKRFYIILAVMPGNEINTDEINAYFNSFTVK